MIQKLKPPTDIVWPVIVLAGYMFFISLVPIKSNDFWWHLKIGELIHSNGKIPTTNIFAWTLPPNQPYFYSAWLAEYLFYVIYLLGKLEAVMFTRNIVIFLVMILMMVETYRQTGSWRLSALTVGIGGLVIFSNTAIRPQIWSILSFAVFLTILNRYRDGQLRSRWLLLCPLVMMFWVNVHGAFVLGIILMGIFIVGEGIRTYLKRLKYLTWTQNGWLVLTGMVTLFSTVINPRGFGIWVYAFGMTTNNDIQDLNWEWQPPTVNTAYLFPLSSNYHRSATHLMFYLAGMVSHTSCDLVWDCCCANPDTSHPRYSDQAGRIFITTQLVEFGDHYDPVYPGNHGSTLVNRGFPSVRFVLGSCL